MKHFEQVFDLPILELSKELESLLESNKIAWPSNYSQICLNTIESKPDDYRLGLGSLYYDWDGVGELDENGILKTKPTVRTTVLKETDFNTLCSQFKNTLFEQVYNAINKKYKIGRVRIMKSMSKTCLSWHTDNTKRLHFPMKTQEGCFMVIEDEVFHLKENTWWVTNTVLPHTAFNGSLDDRIHLVAVILNETD